MRKKIKMTIRRDDRYLENDVYNEVRQDKDNDEYKVNDKDKDIKVFKAYEKNNTVWNEQCCGSGSK